MLALFVNAQDVLIQNGTTNTCSGSFLDSGGEFGNYSGNENFVFTICPDTAGARLTLDFFEFDTQLNTDLMMIYDGDSTASPLFGVFSGVTAPGFIAATLNNPTGCLTIEFTSDGSGNTSGWLANISCTTPCQDITAQLDSTIPAPNIDGIIEVCTGDSVTLNGSGIFEVDGTGATYTWDLGDGNTASGDDVTISYDAPGVYLVNLDIRDTNTDNIIQGCPNTNSINQIIRVSGAPDFTGTQAVDDTLCFGESTEIVGAVTPLTLTYNCPPPESEETFLPDGSGAAYYTCINVTCFEPNAVLTDASQIFDICLNIEHSYSGDLDIKIISPNGLEAALFDRAGGGTYFGGADNNDTAVPGIGADYCFSMSASSLLEDANTIEAGSNPPGQSWEPGTYLPIESFNQLIGSPLNGEWCIEIIDNLPIDNGYIFSWELNFDNSVPQEDFSFVPTIVSESWDPDPTITDVNGTTITVSPTGSGQYCYTYSVVDIFGCEFTEEVCIEVADASQPPVTFFLDSDGDGFGDANNSIVECSSSTPSGYSINDLDCDDTNPSINPGAADSEGNGIDENCDGVDGIALSLEEFYSESLSVYPNPFQTGIKVNLPELLNGNDIEVKIYDINGRVVYDKPHVVIDGQINIDNLNNLLSAPYFMELINEEVGLDITKKLVKL